MRVTRRQFLGYAAAASLSRWRIDRPFPTVRTPSEVLILDLGNGCALRESVSGYERALGARALGLAALPATPPTTLIVPAAADFRQWTVQAIVDCLDARGCVLLETGLAIPHAPPLPDVFGIRTGPPVALWPHAGASRIPYVDFTWPHAVKIRDYSHVVPLDARGDRVIASVDGLPVALLGSRGRGTLIFLGSPIGPALWAGDAEARGWLAAVMHQR